jgi:hypothetical protein
MSAVDPVEKLMYGNKAKNTKTAVRGNSCKIKEHPEHLFLYCSRALSKLNRLCISVVYPV